MEYDILFHLGEIWAELPKCVKVTSFVWFGGLAVCICGIVL